MTGGVLFGLKQHLRCHLPDAVLADRLAPSAGERCPEVALDECHTSQELEVVREVAALLNGADGACHNVVSDAALFEQPVGAVGEHRGTQSTGAEQPIE